MNSAKTTTSQFKLHSQRMALDGGLNQDAVAKLFGKGADEPWAVFFREVFQNSADAQSNREEPFSFIVKAGYLKNAAVGHIAGGLGDASPASCWGPLTKDVLTTKKPTFLLIADKNTTGLKGGTNPQTAEDDSNFKNFFFTLGHSKQTGGGAFGLGRNVFFSASESSTIFVYTRFRDLDGSISARFMGMTAGRHFSESGINYTGRHWWTKLEATDEISPFSDEYADKLAADFGIDIYSAEETGTAVLLVSPSHDDLDELVQTLRTCAEIYTWPHILEKNVKFEFSGPSGELDAIDPTSRKSPVSRFAEAYNAIKDRLGPTNHEVDLMEFTQFKRLGNFLGLDLKSKELGRLAYRTMGVGHFMSHSSLEECGLPSRSSIALMRDARIIVKYLEVRQPDPEQKTQGVFVANTDWDAVFRQSENLTHDEWEPTRLKLDRGAANPVRVLLNGISEKFSALGGGLVAAVNQGQADAQLGDELGELIAGMTGGGVFKPVVDPPPTPPKPGGGGGGEKSKITLKLISNRPESDDLTFTTRVITYECTVKPDAGNYTISAETSTSLGSGLKEKASDAPKGALMPHVESIKVGDKVTAGAFATINGAAGDTTIEIKVKVPNTVKAVFEVKTRKDS